MLKSVYAQNLQELGQAKFDGVFLPQDRDEYVDTDGDPHLGLHRVVSGAKKMPDSQVLLDPLEEQFHSPSQPVELSDDFRFLDVFGGRRDGEIGRMTAKSNDA